MGYIVESESGEKYGPVDLEVLQKWLTEGRLKPEWLATDEATGSVVAVGSLISHAALFAPPPPSAQPKAPIIEGTDFENQSQTQGYQPPSEPSARKYFVIHPSGKRFGPISIEELLQWVQEGRVMPNWLVADSVTNVQYSAGSVLDSAGSRFAFYPRYQHDTIGVAGNQWNLSATIVGVISIAFSITCCFYWVGSIAGFVALCLGIRARMIDKKSGLAGIILGILSLVIGLFLFLAITAFKGQIQSLSGN